MEPVAKRKPKDDEVPKYGYTTCGAEHTGCPNTWKGTCTLAVGHDGSHHCSQCQSVF